MSLRRGLLPALPALWRPVLDEALTPAAARGLVVVVDPLDDHGDQQDRPGDRLGDGDEPEALGGSGQVEE